MVWNSQRAPMAVAALPTHSNTFSGQHDEGLDVLPICDRLGRDTATGSVLSETKLQISET